MSMPIVKQKKKDYHKEGRQKSFGIQVDVANRADEFCREHGLSRREFVEISLNVLDRLGGNPKDYLTVSTEHIETALTRLEKVTERLEKTIEKIFSQKVVEEGITEEKNISVPPMSNEFAETSTEPLQVSSVSTDQALVQASEMRLEDTCQDVADKVMQGSSNSPAEDLNGDDEQYKTALRKFNNLELMNDEDQRAFISHSRCPKCGEEVHKKEGGYIGHTKFIKECDYYVRGSFNNPTIIDKFKPSVQPIRLNR